MPPPPRLPTSAKALVVRKSANPTKPVFHDAVIETRPIPALKPGELLVKVNAVAFNHRDSWIRKGLYPGIGFGNPFGTDGAGIVVAAADVSDPLLNKRVFFNPTRGWISDPDAPETTRPFTHAMGGSVTAVGASAFTAFGTFAEYVVVEREEVLETPAHLDDVHAAAWPLGGLTAWRATMINGGVVSGDNVLITGVGGGVALLAMQLCVARGANVYVTSGSPEKIRQAVELGAKGGVSYKDNGWPTHLRKLLDQHGGGLLSTVIDSAGGDIMTKTSPLLKQGGRVVVYGMHAHPAVTMTMREVMRNQRMLGSTMGSRADMRAATAFLAAHRLVPAVSHVLDGLEAAREGFDLLERGEQFGKIVLRIGRGADEAKAML
ncbi:NAD(P)-binding protein [Epithele typhae]|uniref:NAD(P)-binding protein n=1 Tax=Epithele typhae TaxID=378194 RepID=UPI002007DF69|nr:NAD(P)-binding protein [Epithele typhae]KAH9931711.1 NAD(P)-binding protein [Epithele typhae]